MKNQEQKTEGHLNDSGISLYVEAKMLDKTNTLPKAMRAHVAACASCQMRVADFHQFMKDEQISPANPTSYSDKKMRLLTFNKYTLGRIAAVVLLLVAVYFMLFDATGKLQNAASDYSLSSFKSSITSPFDNKRIDVGYTKWEMNTGEAKVFKLKNGSNIRVPADAFVNKLGEPVKGKVEIKYREFHNAADIIASGLPMHYDSAGVRHHFESGGMFELRGSQNGRPVFIADNKNVEVNLISYNPDKRFNHYFLDEGVPRPQRRVAQAQILPSLSVFQQTPAPNWQLIGAGVTASITNDSTQQNAASQAQAFDKQNDKSDEPRGKTGLRKGPVKPSLAKEATVQKKVSPDYFELKYALDFEPELRTFVPVKWAHADNLLKNDPKYISNKWVLNEPWHKVTLHKLPFGFKTLAVGEATDIKYSADGQRMLAYDQLGKASLYTSEGQLIRQFDQTIATQMSKSGKHILTTQRRAVKLWSSKGELLTALPTKNDLNMAVISDNDQHILTTNAEEQSVLWTLQGKLVRKFHDYFKFASFSPNGEYIATISDRDYSLKIWTSRGKFLHQLKGEYNTAYFSADNRHLLTSSPRNGAQLWFYEKSYHNTMLMNVLKHKEAAVKMATFSHDGQRVLTASNDGTAKVWNVNGQLMKILKVSKTWVNSAIFSADDQMILTADDYGTAKLWSKEGKLLHTLRGHSQGLNGAVFSPDQQKIVTFSKDQTMKIWNRNKPLKETYALDLSNIGPHYEEMYKLQMNRYLMMKRYSSDVMEKKKIKRPIRNQLRKFFTIVKMYRPALAPNTMVANTKVENKLEAFKKMYNQELAAVEKEREKQEEARRKIEEKDRQLAKREAQLFHKFKVSNFGYYNVDRILKMTGRDVVICQADVTLNKTDGIYSRLYLVTGDKGTGVVKFDANSLNLFWFQPKHNNQLVVVLPNNKVALFSPQEFKKIDLERLRRDKYYIFNLTKVHQVGSVNQLAKLLNVPT
ncbi:WD40 repeat domain-containing protein [Microscilla marina]|uniref:Uncharacterized protein n=1 Tax=Microscilla marina ATCC 23134 TaxID=313606 RepID=A1ZHX5_MICM2|nr:hypothetical protein [Microscilla marina]EAY30132.1 hypothetical protein M23134_05465 [Microscilla marina ATCC 23134]